MRTEATKVVRVAEEKTGEVFRNKIRLVRKKMEEVGN